jgi:hypothetical protein
MLLVTDDGTANIIASDAVFDGDGFDADYTTKARSQAERTFVLAIGIVSTRRVFVISHGV